MTGSYILLVTLTEEQTIAIGSLRAIRFPRGNYAYVGSAMGGLKSRLRHHLNDNKRLHWHIDYLLQQASINSIILSVNDGRLECAVAQALSHHLDFIPGFGSSDCRCRSHLFLAVDDMETTVMAILNRLNMRAIPLSIPERKENIALF